MKTRIRTRRLRSGLAASAVLGAALLGVALAQAPSSVPLAPAPAAQQRHPADVAYRTITVDGVNIFYREAGPPDAPVILLLHGFPSSSHMFRNLIPQLADRYRVIAPDYPGYGYSDQPPRESFAYTFDHLAHVIDDFTRAIKLDRFALYMHDYGAPIGFRIAAATPERITGLIIQNGNAYEEGLPDSFWGPIKTYWKERSPEARAALAPFLAVDVTRWQYITGVRDVTSISPDAWLHDQRGLDRPGNVDIQLDLFLDYGSNPPLYPAWQAYFREHQPPTLIVWGKNDPIFPAAGAEPYRRDLKNVDFNLFDTGHFALEEDGRVIAQKIRNFMQSRVVPTLR